MNGFRRRLDLQAKIILVLVAVVVPTFLIVTLAENKLTKPVLEDDLRQVGINAAKTLASEIVSSRLTFKRDPGSAIEDRIQEILYSQPNIFRMDAALRNQATHQMKTVASSVEDDPGTPPLVLPQVDSITSAYKLDDSGDPYWEIEVPIQLKSRDPRGPKRLVGTVRALVSLQLVSNIAQTLWRATVTAAVFSVLTLIFVLSYFLRKTISNDRRLRAAESQNLQLTEQLHEAHRQVMNTEKLAVMGQLTASFAHEIGTPLNAIGGHLQLLKEEMGEAVGAPVTTVDRLEIINGQVSKIEEIVKSFLQSTSKPASQRQLVDLNLILDRTLGIIRPRAEACHVRIKRHFDRGMGPIRVVPLDLEQVFLNLLNNSVDSLNSKAQLHPENWKPELQIDSQSLKSEGKEWAQVSVYDTGEGIKKADLGKVLKPFFTTKRPGEGTGLGLAICQQLVHKYGGEILIDSKEGVWTRVTVKIPYQANA